MSTLATILFALAVLHTFFAAKILEYSRGFKKDSIASGVFHLLGEVEIVFGFWAGIFILSWSVLHGAESAKAQLESVNFVEPVFVFAVMTICATRPIIESSRALITFIAKRLPFGQPLAVYVSALTLGPLIGSLITEPAAMTITALLLHDVFFKQQVSDRFRYITIGLLFVNISIGGMLTHFAAPPVLMVAAPWGWDTQFMFTTFGWKALIAVFVNTLIAVTILRGELESLKDSVSIFEDSPIQNDTLWMACVHAFFIVAVVYFSTSTVVIFAVFLFFLGWHQVTVSHQEKLRIKEGLLVGFFLAGLIVLGKLQGWWIKPIISELSPGPLFWGTTFLTAFTDNAALTYLSTLVSGISEASKYAVVAGAVTGGGLTVIANAPNLAGFTILQDTFTDGVIKPLGLLLGAVIFTFVSAAAFLLL